MSCASLRGFKVLNPTCPHARIEQLQGANDLAEKGALPLPGLHQRQTEPWPRYLYGHAGRSAPRPQVEPVESAIAYKSCYYKRFRNQNIKRSRWVVVQWKRCEVDLAIPALEESVVRRKLFDLRIWQLDADVTRLRDSCPQLIVRHWISSTLQGGAARCERRPVPPRPA